MRTFFVLAFLVALALGGWRIGACELANMQLQEDMQDLAAQAGVRIGHYTAPSDDDFRAAVIRKAQEYDIQLSPDQVTVQRQGSDASSPMYLAADYTVPVNLASYSVTLHFTPSSTRKSF
jgi:putative aminopeptidase FrvX